jgi:dephospho-CoA kinase
LNTSLKKENNQPILVGITGGIGSGKSTVAKVFQSMGIPVFNSDVIAKDIVNTNEEVVSEIKNLLGDVYVNDKLNAPKVAEIVFKDKAVLQQLNTIIHPRVQDAFELWVKKNNNERIVMKEAAILVEVGAYKNLDKLVLVISDEQTKVKRVMLRDGVSEEAVKKKMQNQLSDEEKKPFADYVIQNNDSDMIIPQVLNLLEELNG